MRAIRLMLLALTAVCVSGLGLAMADTKDPKKDPAPKVTPLAPRFKALDKNKDDKLSLEEYTSKTKDKPAMKGRLTAFFKRLDKDKDGLLTAEELKDQDKLMND